MQQCLKAKDDFDATSKNADGTALLLGIKAIMFNFQSQKYLAYSLHELKSRLYTCCPGKFMMTQAYLEQFINTVEVIENSRGSIGNEPGIVRAATLKTRGLSKAAAA
jgi:hypothetical protein